MTNFVKVSEVFSRKNVSLIVNRTSNESNYDVLKFQPQAELSYNSNRGIHCDNHEYIDKVRSFFRLVIDKQPALVLTPEGSIPYDMLQEIVDCKTKWPDTSKLWCLCMSGIIKTDFKELIKALTHNSHLSLHIESEDNINYKKHVNALFYLFRLDTDTLAVLIQLKNHNMADRRIENEANDLSLGNTIYIFDLNNGEDTKNVMVTLICADAIQIAPSGLIHNLKGKYPLIINLQCNMKPYDYRFISSRTSIFYDCDISKQRQIVANWAKGTKFSDNDIINDSGNAYYNYLSVSGLPRLDNICRDKETFIHRMENQINGATYFANENANIWKFPNSENLIRFYIKKEDVFGIDSSLSSRFDPIIKEIFIYADSTWKRKHKHCMLKDDKIPIALYSSRNDNFKTVFHQFCSDNSCTNQCFMLYNDFFLGLCMGGGIKDELKCDGETSNRALAAINNGSICKTEKKRELFSTLVGLLENNKIPKELKLFIDNVKFDIDSNAAECGSNNIYNVKAINSTDEYPNWSDKKGIFAVIDTTQIETVEKTYDLLSKSTNIEIKDQILLYYREEGQYVPYTKPHKLQQIGPTYNSFTKSTTSIIYGESSYEEN
ncbi:MAG: hypothetical protein PHR19_07670 [Bacteroidales bacterium]|nr:hypothetical protein [Bacteroidales bacterium]